jgi:hypothetical protein
MRLDGDGNSRAIPVVGPDIPYGEFLDRFLRPLQPCIITGLTSSWPAVEKWATSDTTPGNIVPNYAALRDTFGSCDGCITFCDELNGNGDFTQREMPVAQFIDEFCNNSDEGKSRKTYLKDFHFMRVNQFLKPPYTVPIYFQGTNIVHSNGINDRRLVQSICFGKQQRRFPVPVPRRRWFIYASASRCLYVSFMVYVTEW